MATISCRPTMIRRTVTIAAVLGAAAGGAVTILPPAAAAAPAPAAAGPLGPAQAQAQAQATGQPVTVSALTTPSSVTTANPDGSFTTDESATPVRAWRDGAWTALDPTLHPNAGGTISPAVTTSGLALSGGGTGPLAVMTAAGRSLSLTWPGTLPAPAVSGATATYGGVLPGVDLVITTDRQGGFSDVLVVKTAAAAADPALASLKLSVASHGLVLSADAAGDLTATAGPGAPPLITAQAPQMWDSAQLPAGTATVAGPGGTALVPPAGAPAASSLTGPGAGAHVAAVPASLSGSTLTLSPPASALSGPGITYPVYIDPTWHNFAGTNASAWTQVDSGFPTTTYWDESGELQTGECPVSYSTTCNGLGVARSFIRMPLPSLQKNVDVHAAELYMDDVWSADGCTATAEQLWNTYGISSSTDWDKQPSWRSELQQKSFAFGSSGCGSYKDDVTWSSSALTSLMQHDISDGNPSQTFGLRAASETNQLQWKKYHNPGSGYIHLSVTYNYPPDQPTSPATSPGGACHTSSSAPAIIGDDDVTFFAHAKDNDGDNSLTTQFVLYNSDGSTAWNSASNSDNVVTGNDTTAELTLTRAVMQGLHSDGATTAYTYYWQAQTTDAFGLASTWSTKCWLSYNPAAPAAPTLTAPASGTLGQQAAVTFTAPSGCSPSTSPCPVSYTYQLGAAAPVTVTADSSGDWSGDITISQVGPIQLTAYGIATGGNPGPPGSTQITGNPPSASARYQDGYFTGGTYPDLLYTGTGAEPSLWLATGTGNGTINTTTPLDIGSLGTTLNPGTDGPGDWKDAIVLHGDFTGDNIQDVMAYYPTGGTGQISAGSGEIIAGNGNSAPLVPDTSLATIDATLMQSSYNGDVPVQLVAAGNVSGLSTGTDDLIGISGNTITPIDNYELDLYTNLGFAGGYAFTQTLTTTAPDGSSDWNNYTLATAGNPASTVLFTLNTTTGALYECTTPSDLVGQNGNQGTCTWTQISVPWGNTPPTLVQGDINAAGQTELWTLASGTATAWTLSGTSLAKETASTASGPSNDWPVTDGNPLAQGTATTTATDTITGSPASLTGATWNSDDYFSTDLSFDGKTGFMAPPTDPVPNGDGTATISVWFQTTSTNEALVSLENSPITAGTAAGSPSPSGYNPVLYIGADGKLCFEWWNGHAYNAMSSTSAVNDGLWHHATLAAASTSQTLTLDGKTQTLTGTVSINSSYFYIGTGYLGGGWPDEEYNEINGNIGYLTYFNGQIADVTFTK